MSTPNIICSYFENTCHYRIVNDVFITTLQCVFFSNRTDINYGKYNSKSSPLYTYLFQGFRYFLMVSYYTHKFKVWGRSMVKVQVYVNLSVLKI